MRAMDLSLGGGGAVSDEDLLVGFFRGMGRGQTSESRDLRRARRPRAAVVDGSSDDGYGPFLPRLVFSLSETERALARPKDSITK